MTFLKNNFHNFDKIILTKKVKPDNFISPDYFKLDDLLTEEHKLVRDTTRSWVKKNISPIIEKNAQEATFPKEILPGLSEIGAFGCFIPQKYVG